MNKELRKMRDEVNKYVVLFAEHPEKVKENLNDISLDVKSLKDMLTSYLDKICKIFQMWCDRSVEIFNSDDRNVFLQLKKAIKMFEVNYYLNKLSYEMYVVGILDANLDVLAKRVEQISILT